MNTSLTRHHRTLFTRLACLALFLSFHAPTTIAAEPDRLEYKVKQEPFDALNKSTNGVDPEDIKKLFLSPDLTRFAFVKPAGLRGVKVVLNGNEGPLVDGILNNSVFFDRDLSHAYYIADIEKQGVMITQSDAGADVFYVAKDGWTIADRGDSPDPREWLLSRPLGNQINEWKLGLNGPTLRDEMRAAPSSYLSKSHSSFKLDRGGFAYMEHQYSGNPVGPPSQMDSILIVNGTELLRVRATQVPTSPTPLTFEGPNLGILWFIHEPESKQYALIAEERENKTVRSSLYVNGKRVRAGREIHRFQVFSGRRSLDCHRALRLKPRASGRGRQGAAVF